jgi:CRP/FNR family transcriptional regulator, cyclic AMP receptor protein
VCASQHFGSPDFRNGSRGRGGLKSTAWAALALRPRLPQNHGSRIISNLAMNRQTPHSADALGDLPPELADALFSKARNVVLEADRSLFMVGDEGNGCYRVEEGLLKASISAPNGSERILAIFAPGAVIGELAMIDGGARSASVTALRDSKLSFVGRATFEAFVQENPELCRQLVVLLARRLRDTNHALTATNFLSVKGRVASALLQLAEGFGRDVGSGRILVRQKVSQNDLAAMAGVCARKCQPGTNGTGLIPPG